jgi:hypothetical protein
MDEKKPSRRGRRKKQTHPLAEDELLPISKAESININQVFAQALKQYKDELLQRKSVHNKDLGQLNSIVEEYLSCFAIVGFSLQGDKVCIFNANTAKDEGALVDHLRSTFIDIANNRP